MQEKSVRKENISKDGFPFARIEYIIPQAQAIFESLRNDRFLQDRAADEFSVGAAKYMADLNVLHPFREGNGRAQREFIRCLALKAGFILDWSSKSKGEVLLASIQSKYDETHLARVIRACIVRKQ